MIETYYNQAESPTWVKGIKQLSLDIETTGLDPWTDRIAVVTIKAPTGEAAVVRCHGGVVPGWLQDLLNDHSVELIGFNLVGFDALFLANAGVDLSTRKGPELYDAMNGELVTLVANRRSTRVSLSATVKRRTGDQLNKEMDHGGWEADELSDRQLEYVLGDVDKLFELKAAQEQKVLGTPRQAAMAFERDLTPITIGMTQRGMPFDEMAYGWIYGQAQADIARLEPKLEARLGEINFRSHTQLKRALANVGIFVPNTRRETFEELASDLDDGHIDKELAKDLITVKQQKHRCSVWDDEWVTQWVKSDGCVHPRYWQLGTDTIRYSSSEPNGQQFVRSWRGMFGGVDGMDVVSPDYAQLEVRIAACIFKDEALAEVCLSEDIHAAVYAQAMGLPISEVIKDKEKRRLGKAMNFLLIFGGGWSGFLAYATRYGAKMTEADAKEIVYGYRRKFRGVDQARLRAISMADSGRPITLNLPKGHQRMLFGEKLGPTTILNTSVQGTAATGIKCAMLEMHRREMSKFLRMQVHDELVSLVPKSESKAFAEEKAFVMKKEMEKILPPVVPIEVEVKIGSNWS